MEKWKVQKGSFCHPGGEILAALCFVVLMRSLLALRVVVPPHSGVAKELDLQGNVVTRKSSDMLPFRRKVVP